VGLTLGNLPRFLVLEPVSTVRFELRLSRPACEIDVELENPKPGRSFLLLIGPQGGPVVQRMRLSGRARIVFEPADDRRHVLMLANPQKEPLVLKLRGRSIRRPVAATGVGAPTTSPSGRRGASRRRPRVRVSAGPPTAPKG
jgi:hypothetical protein